MTDINQSSSEAWDHLVGSQSPEEFMKISTKRKAKSIRGYSDQQIEKAVKSYVKDLPRMFPEYREGEYGYDEKELLEHYIKRNCKITKKGLCSLHH